MCVKYSFHGFIPDSMHHSKAEQFNIAHFEVLLAAPNGQNYKTQ